MVALLQVLLLLSSPASQVLSAEPSEGDKESLRALVPEETEISGLKTFSGVAFYVPANLWDYMDGQAEVYLDYGFQVLLSGEYGAGDGSIITLEIYRMKSPQHAFGIHAAERTREDRFVQIGVGGFWGNGVLGFWKGSYYIKVLSSRMSEAGRVLLEKVGRAIAGKIRGTYREPELLSVFPAEHRVRMSERFIPKNFLGQPFLKNGYRVDYEREGKGYQIFLLQEGSKEEAEGVFERYEDFLRPRQEKIGPPKKGDYRSVVVEGEERKALFRYGPFFGGILNGRDFSEDERVIQKMVSRLKDFGHGQGQRRSEKTGNP